METKAIRDQYVATENYLAELNKTLRSAIFNAIVKAEEEKGEKTYFNGLREWMKAPFGHKPTGKEAYDTIMYNANSTKDTEYVIESVMGGYSSYAKKVYPVSDWKLIAKYL